MRKVLKWIGIITPLLIMPSQVYYHYSDEDVAAIDAYAKRVPPVDNELPL